MEEDLDKWYAGLLGEHCDWLKAFNGKHLKKWEDLFNASENGKEAAICEAATQKLLSQNGCTVEPYLFDKGPDFKCTQNSKSFYVEATCITIEKATKATGMESEPQGSGHRCIDPAIECIKGEISNKTKQCSNLDSPCLLIIGTLHQMAGFLWSQNSAIEKLLTASPKIGASLTENRFEPTGFISDLNDSVFIRFDKNGNVETARHPISAVLMLKISSNSPWIAKGGLHPHPIREFDRDLLPNIKFCRLVDGYQGGLLQTEWI